VARPRGPRRLWVVVVRGRAAAADKVAAKSFIFFHGASEQQACICLWSSCFVPVPSIEEASSGVGVGTRAAAEEDLAAMYHVSLVTRQSTYVESAWLTDLIHCSRSTSVVSQRYYSSCLLSMRLTSVDAATPRRREKAGHG
jgi:hypothetical protein